MKPIYHFCLMFIFGVACTSVKVFSDYDQYSDFSKFRTFELSAPKALVPGDPLLNQLNQNHLRASITNEMLIRGYLSSNDPDIIININVIIKPKTKFITSSLYPYFPYRGQYQFYGKQSYYKYWGLRWPYTPVKVMKYKEGTLIIDMIDTENEQLVWHGIATRTLRNLPKDHKATISEAVNRIFNEFPYNAGSNKTIVLRQ